MSYTTYILYRYFYSTGRYLKKKLPFLSESKTGIWGWGYGGYVAGMVLARDKENVFECALSVAPITDWIYHS